MSIDSTDVLTKTKEVTTTVAKVDMRPPSMFNVVLYNDNTTTVDFVVLILMTVFHKSFEDASELTLQIHEHGKGIAGTYSHEVAVQKRDETTHVSHMNNFQLKCEIEVS